MIDCDVMVKQAAFWCRMVWALSRRSQSTSGRTIRCMRSILRHIRCQLDDDDDNDEDDDDNDEDDDSVYNSYIQHHG